MELILQRARGCDDGPDGHSCVEVEYETELLPANATPPRALRVWDKGVLVLCRWRHTSAGTVAEYLGHFKADMRLRDGKALVEVKLEAVLDLVFSGERQNAEKL